MRRNPSIEPSEIEDVVFGAANQSGEDNRNVARMALLLAGLPTSVAGVTVNRLCASGLQAVALGAQAIASGQSRVVLSGGIESMSRMPYLIDSDDARWGHKMGNFPLVDAMYRDGFLCPLSGLLMGETAEILARQYGITRDESDCFALESQRQVVAAVLVHCTTKPQFFRQTHTPRQFLFD
jgi:acetyl-CoA acetyltransferase